MALAWTLFVGAWLVLGSLGRSTSMLWFAGLGPVATWLAATVATSAIAGKRGPSRRLVAVAGLLTAGGLAIGDRTGSGAAVFAAAAGWGVLSCAASRRAGASGDAGIAPACIVPPRAWADPAAWPAFGARWAMLPMMAALAVQSDWCAGIGVSPAQGVALHLAAMLAPAALLRLAPAPRSLHSPLWIAVFMAAGVAALPLVAGVRGWMAMSLLHALAWGLAWSQDLPRAGKVASRRSGRASGDTWLALSPAVGVLALGATIAAFGLDGLVAVHVALGALSLAGAMGWLIVDARHHAQLRQEERLS